MVRKSEMIGMMKRQTRPFSKRCQIETARRPDTEALYRVSPFQGKDSAEHDHQMKPLATPDEADTGRQTKLFSTRNEAVANAERNLFQVVSPSIHSRIRLRTLYMYILNQTGVLS